MRGNNGNRENSWEATIRTQERDDCGLGQVDSGGCYEKWLHSGYILKRVSKAFADRTGIVHKRNRECLQGFWPKHQEEWSPSLLRWGPGRSH